MLRQIVTSLVIMALVQAQLAWAHPAMGGLRARRVAERQGPVGASHLEPLTLRGETQAPSPQKDSRLHPVEIAIPVAMVVIDQVVKWIIPHFFKPGDRLAHGILGLLVVGNHHHYLSLAEVVWRWFFASILVLGTVLFFDPEIDQAMKERHLPLKSIRRGLMWAIAGAVGIMVDLTFHGGRYVIDWLQFAYWTQPIPPFIFAFNLSDVALYVAIGISLSALLRLSILKRSSSTEPPRDGQERSTQGFLLHTSVALRALSLSL